jgi:hypothetical protein
MNIENVAAGISRTREAKPDRRETGSIEHFHSIVFYGTPERGGRRLPCLER